MIKDKKAYPNLPDRAPDGTDIARQVKRIRNENKALFAQLIEGEKRFRSLAKAVWMVQEEERRSLARELHDGIGQTLTALKNQLERISVQYEEDELLASAVELSSTALNDTRELSRLLRPAVLDDLGLDAALRWLTRTLGKRTNMVAEVKCNLGEQRLQADIETLVFRVVQESLTNIIKHANVKHAEVDVHIRAALLIICIHDEGEGFEPEDAYRSAAESESLGLRGIRDRLELFGGRFDVRSSPGNGCTLTMSIPLTETQSTDNGDPQ